jgi:hypothetical protein
MAITLNSAISTLPLPKVDFSWSPIGAAITYSFAGNSYPPAGSRFEAFFTPVNQVLTFTATATPATNTSIVLYKWDMGDGQVQYGQTVGHTYTVPNQSLTCKLEVTDTLNRKVYVSKAMLLQVQFATIVQDHFRV